VQTYLSPAELSRSFEETRAAWQALRNQAYGRGAAAREVPAAVKPLQDEIMVTFEQFQQWADQVGPLDYLSMSYGGELSGWRDRYDDIAKRWMKAMKTTVVMLPPTRGVVTGVVTAAADAAASAVKGAVAPSGGIFWLALILGAGYLYLHRPQQQQQAPKGGV